MDNNPKYDPFFALLEHHVDSYNQFIDETIPSILQDEDNIVLSSENKAIKYRLTFENLGIKPLTLDNDEGLMFPLDALQKNLSYSAKYTATVIQWQDIIDISTGITETKIVGIPETYVPIAKIPVMVGSYYEGHVSSWRFTE